MIDSPRFTEKRDLALFSCGELTDPDTKVVIRVNDRIAVPECGGMVKDDAETFFIEDECVTVVRSGRDHRVLWKTETRGKDVYAEIAPDRVSTLNTYEILRISDLPRALLLNGALVLHASFIEHEGKALLFSGDKQVGKSTQARLWHETKSARILNGDRALLEKKNGVWYASGLPFAGTSGICENGSFPVQAVVMLSQNSVNTVTSAAASESVFFLARQCTFERADKKQMDLFLTAAESAASGIPFIRFSCRPDLSAVSALETALMEL